VSNLPLSETEGRLTARPDPRDDDQNVEETGTTDAQGGAVAPSDQGADAEMYRLVSIDAVRAPEGCTGGDWHAYKIAQGENGITGYRRGDLVRVRADVGGIVAALNERRQWTKRKAVTSTERRAAAAARRAAAK
jgi:hypothetical protein